MKRKLSKLIKSRRLMAALAALLFASDMVITMMATNTELFDAKAAITVSLADMKSRAEAIINYEWVPTNNMATWNNSVYNGSKMFYAGRTVKGVPFSLFTSEVCKKSQMTLSEYKNMASHNYSTTAVCKSTSNQYRTGPVYGSCCAAFVSEVMGGSWMGNNVTSIATSRQASHVKNAYAKQVRVGDALDKGSHILWIGDITDEYFVIYEQTPPVAHKVLLKKSSAIDLAGRFRYGNNAYTRITRYNLQNTNLTVSAPVARSTAAYYAENAEATIKWNLDPNVSYYLVDVSKNGKSIVKQEAIVDNFYKINKGNGNYEVYVTAVCGSNTKKSSRVSFTIGRLDTPVIKNTAQYLPSGSKVGISWSTCIGATGYHLSITKDNKIKYRDVNLKGTSYSITPEDGYYEAIVEAKNENGGLQKTTSKKFSFFVGNKRIITIDSSVIYYAHNGSVNVKWNDCEGVSDYTLRVFSGGTECFKTNVSGSHSYAVNNLPDGYFKAVVSAVESTGQYDWVTSKEFGFYVGKLDKPVVVPDTKYHGANSKASVSWKSCTGAAKYHITVRSGKSVVYEDDLSGTTCRFDVTKGKYIVTVDAVNTNGGLQKKASTAVEVWAVSIGIKNALKVMKPGQSAVFRAEVSEHDPADALTWSSSQEKILTVSSNGKITAKGAGISNVKVSLGKYAVSCSVNVVPDLSFDTLGASVRLSKPYGIRFGMRVDKNKAFSSVNIVEYGTLIIGAGNLGNSELTLKTPKALKIKADKFLENTSGHITYTGVLINIPKSFFNTPVVGRGYIKYRGVDGNVYVVYSTNVEKSFNGVVSSAYENYLRISKPNQTQKEIIKKLKALYDEANPNQSKPASTTSSTVQQTTTVTSVNGQSVSQTSDTEPSVTVTSVTQPTTVASAEQPTTSTSTDGEPGATTSASEEHPSDVTSPAGQTP